VIEMKVARGCAVALGAAAILAALGGVVPGAKAFTEGEMPSDAAAAYRSLIPAAPKGAVSWEMLEKATVAVDESAKDGIARPRFTDEVAALDGKQIRVKGYIFPLSQASRQSRFLLTAYPPDCPFCMPAGPTQMILVESARPVEYSMEPVVVAGRLELQKTANNGLLYKVVGAQLEAE
jgi:hypothetical protein